MINKFTASFPWNVGVGLTGLLSHPHQIRFRLEGFHFQQLLGWVFYTGVRHIYRIHHTYAYEKGHASWLVRNIFKTFNSFGRKRL